MHPRLMHHQLMGSSHDFNEDVMGNAPSNMACTWLCGSSQLCQCVTGIVDRSVMLTGMPGYRPFSLAFNVCIFILLAVSQGHSSQK